MPPVPRLASPPIFPACVTSTQTTPPTPRTWNPLGITSSSLFLAPYYSNNILPFFPSKYSYNFSLFSPLFCLHLNFLYFEPPSCLARTISELPNWSPFFQPNSNPIRPQRCLQVQIWPWPPAAQNISMGPYHFQDKSQLWKMTCDSLPDLASPSFLSIITPHFPFTLPR